MSEGLRDTIKGQEGAAEAPIPVLFVLLHTGNRANGGIESITQVIEHLPNIKPFVVTQRDMPVNERWRSAGAHVEVWPFLDDGLNVNRGRGEQAAGPARQIAALFRANSALYRYIREKEIQVVHCNGRHMLWHAGWGARAAGARVVFNVRDVRRPSNPYGWKWRVAHLSDRIVCLSREMKTALERRLPGLPPFKKGPPPVEHIYSIIDFDAMHPVADEERQAIRQELDLVGDGLVLPYVATVNDKKNQLGFIREAGPLLKKHLPNARVYFVGDFEPGRSEYARRCQEAVRTLELEDTFTFAGYTDRVADWYRAADVTLLASRREGMARGMIESLACGTPVVSFDVCSAREILEEHECGVVARQGEYASFVRGVRSLAEDGEGRREQLGTSGHQAARKLFAPDEIGARYEAVYREAAERAARS